MIQLKNPADGSVVSLQTSVQKEFIRDGRKYLTGQLDLQSFRWQYEDYYDTSRPSRVCFRWEAKDALTSTIEISKHKDFSDIFLSAVCQDRFDGYNFEIGTTYYWRVRNPRQQSDIFSFTTEDAAPRFMYFAGTTNVRDIGGFVTEDGQRIKQGLLFRGAELDMHINLLPEGMRVMHDVVGIKSDIDLRGEARDFSTRSPIGEDVNFVQLPIGAYENFVSEENREGLAKIFSLLADEKGYPFYFHCWGGADRTGCLAFAIEAILGLSEENLMRNFELTTLSGMGNIKNRNEEGFSNMINHLTKYGKNWKERMTNFLDECGISKETLDKIRDIMLEKA